MANRDGEDQVDHTEIGNNVDCLFHYLEATMREENQYVCYFTCADLPASHFDRVSWLCAQTFSASWVSAPRSAAVDPQCAGCRHTALTRPAGQRARIDSGSQYSCGFILVLAPR